MVINIEKYPSVRDITQTPDDLILFENKIIEYWEGGKIRGPIHLSNGNEVQLIEIFTKIKPTDWVFSTWRCVS